MTPAEKAAKACAKFMTETLCLTERYVMVMTGDNAEDYDYSRKGFTVVAEEGPFRWSYAYREDEYGMDMDALRQEWCAAGGPKVWCEAANHYALTFYND